MRQLFYSVLFYYCSDAVWRFKSVVVVFSEVLIKVYAFL